jgi:hypothetical protein
MEKEMLLSEQGHQQVIIKDHQAQPQVEVEVEETNLIMLAVMDM